MMKQESEKRKLPPAEDDSGRDWLGRTKIRTTPTFTKLQPKRSHTDRKVTTVEGKRDMQQNMKQRSNPNSRQTVAKGI
ncbi:unnamed protein product [Linum trigynum]|uniref:Uncharacterized protein n=1 Tax=Linum trigynum TaxID=586398 RepID=A0AAV2GQR5_9ROSI